MNEKRMLEAFGGVEDCYIVEANPLNRKKKEPFKKMWWIAAAACVCLLLAGGYGISLHAREPYHANDINTEDAIASFPYGDTMVYVFQKDIESIHEYAFEVMFEYKGMHYSLLTDTNTETHIYEMVETMLGESDKHVFSDVLGFDTYYVKAEETFKRFVNWKYFTEINGVETGIAEVFGYTTPKPEIYQKDVDGDGVAELICNSMYGTGAARVYIYRNHNGVIEVGYFSYDLTDETIFPGITNMGAGYIQEIYHPENETFEISYTVEDGTKSVFLEDIEWVEFVPYEVGYF